jgi:hypothetical protein
LCYTFIVKTNQTKFGGEKMKRKNRQNRNKDFVKVEAIGDTLFITTTEFDLDFFKSFSGSLNINNIKEKKVPGGKIIEITLD